MKRYPEYWQGFVGLRPLMKRQQDPAYLNPMTWNQKKGSFVSVYSMESSKGVKWSYILSKKYRNLRRVLFYPRPATP